ncbi:UNVERIFIED_CONTAM: hypothetical protein FKN15_078338 [Acipenser sinensis]
MGGEVSGRAGLTVRFWDREVGQPGKKQLKHYSGAVAKGQHCPEHHCTICVYTKPPSRLHSPKTGDRLFVLFGTVPCLLLSPICCGYSTGPCLAFNYNLPGYSPQSRRPASPFISRTNSDVQQAPSVAPFLSNSGVQQAPAATLAAVSVQQALTAAPFSSKSGVQQAPAATLATVSV